MSGFARLRSDVIGVGLCAECGACAGVCPSRNLSMNIDTEEPELRGQCPPRCTTCYEVCPGKDIPMLELDRVTFGRARELGGDEELLGIAREFLTANAVDSAIRNSGASGGVVPALLIYALENNIIDAALVAGMDEERPWRIVPRIAASRNDVLAHGKTKLTMVPTDALLGEAISKGFRRLAVVGCPCHIHALRKMKLSGKLKKTLESIKFCIGLCCGSNCSYQGTEHLVEEVIGVPVDQVAKLWYRAGEYPGKFTIVTKDGRTLAISTIEYIMQCLKFKRDRCAMCYDYSSELADVSVGDYFFPDIKRGDPGISAVIVRTETGSQIIEGARKNNFISTKPLDKANFFMGGFETKKHGGAYYLSTRRKWGWPTPDNQLPLHGEPMPRKTSTRHPLFTSGETP